MTITVLTIVIAVVVLALALFLFRAITGVQASVKLRGQRLVTCPQTQSAAAVEVAATEAALGCFVNEPTLRLEKCSPWPERQNCGQECLQQIEAEPQNCLVHRRPMETQGKLRPRLHNPALTAAVRRVPAPYLSYEASVGCQAKILSPPGLACRSRIACPTLS